MNLTPEQQAEVLRQVAENVTTELRELCGGSFADWFVIPLDTVAQMVGMTKRRLTERIPVTAIGPQSHGVTFGKLKTYLEENTTDPLSKVKAAAKPKAA